MRGLGPYFQLSFPTHIVALAQSVIWGATVEHRLIVEDDNDNDGDNDNTWWLVM